MTIQPQFPVLRGVLFALLAGLLAVWVGLEYQEYTKPSSDAQQDLALRLPTATRPVSTSTPTPVSLAKLILPEPIEELEEIEYATDEELIGPALPEEWGVSSISTEPVGGPPDPIIVTPSPRIVVVETEGSTYIGTAEDAPGQPLITVLGPTPYQIPERPEQTSESEDPSQPASSEREERARRSFLEDPNEHRRVDSVNYRISEMPPYGGVLTMGFAKGPMPEEMVEELFALGWQQNLIPERPGSPRGKVVNYQAGLLSKTVANTFTEYLPDPETGAQRPVTRTYQIEIINHATLPKVTITVTCRQRREASTYIEMGNILDRITRSLEFTQSALGEYSRFARELREVYFRIENEQASIIVEQTPSNN